MNEGPITTFGAAARELRIPGEALAPIVEGLDITPKPVPHNGKAKGLDAADMAKLRRFLKREPLAASA